MELEEFIRTSLLDIMRAVKNSQDEWKKETPGIAGAGVISPSWHGPQDFKNRVQEVKFDVAVTAGSKTDGGGGGGIKVLGLDLSAKLNHAAENSTVSRISFSVPILPATTTIRFPDDSPEVATAGPERK
jgi:hypothetical protein